VLLPTPSVVNLGRGITTDPFKLQIQTKPPMLQLEAGLKVPVPKQSEPLDFVSFLLNSNITNLLQFRRMLDNVSWLEPDRRQGHGTDARFLGESLWHKRQDQDWARPGVVY
jgi:hypothetical protein